MNKLHLIISIITLSFFIKYSNAQSLFTEVGFGIGNVVGEKHTLGKSEIYFNILKNNKFGAIGFDFYSGGNFIPGERSIIKGNTEILSPNDTRFNSISIFYRMPIKNSLYIEPRFGYTTLSYFVHTDDKTKIRQPNINYGIGIGLALFSNLSLSIRYQYLGNTPKYIGLKGTTTVVSNSEPINLALIRMGYRFSWDKLFKK
jgi:hypothetical protein